MEKACREMLTQKKNVFRQPNRRKPFFSIFLFEYSLRLFNVLRDLVVQSLCGGEFFLSA